MSKEERFLNNYYNMKSNIKLADYLSCRARLSYIDIYSIDKEINEEYFGTLGREDINDLTAEEQAYKVVKITDDFIVIYKEKEREIYGNN